MAQSLSPIWRVFTPVFVNHKEGGTRLAAASDKVCQLLAHGRWFSLGTPASSTTKTGRHDIAESSVKHNKSINLILQRGGRRCRDRMVGQGFITSYAISAPIVTTRPFSLPCK